MAYDAESVVDAIVVNGVDVTVSLSSDWGAGYCADVFLRNTSGSAVSSWTVVVELNQSQLSNLWNGTHSVSGSRMTVRPLSWNTQIAPGASVNFGYCASSTGGNYRPTIASATINGGGSGTGGSTGSGGSSTGGSSSTGGTSSGGSSSTGGTSSTGGASTGGSATGGSGGGAVPQPPAAYQQTLDLTWREMTGGFEGLTGARPRSASVQTFRNTILDQLFASDGTLRYCVRWDSSSNVSPTVRDQIGPALQRNMDAWFTKLGGYDRWPHATPPRVKVTGWAVRNRNQLQWSDNSVPVYVNDIRENAPQCAATCGRFFNRQDGYQYPNCPGGFDNHYDMSLWLTDGFGGGAGGDWGQRLGTSGFLNSLGSGTNTIVLHEIGHGFGMPDYYNWSVWAPGVAAPNSVMVAGRAREVTDWDTWMFRRIWTELKGRWL